jgi:hypothetical protein
MRRQPSLRGRTSRCAIDCFGSSNALHLEAPTVARQVFAIDIRCYGSILESNRANRCDERRS